MFPAKYVDINTTISSQATAIVTRSTNLHDMQIYGVIITALLGLAVFGGAKIIARLGPGFLIPVMVSLLFIFVGIVTAPRGEMSREASAIKRYCCLLSPIKGISPGKFSPGEETVLVTLGCLKSRVDTDECTAQTSAATPVFEPVPSACPWR